MSTNPFNMQTLAPLGFAEAYPDRWQHQSLPIAVNYTVAHDGDRHLRITVRGLDTIKVRLSDGTIDLLRFEASVVRVMGLVAAGCHDRDDVRDSLRCTGSAIVVGGQVKCAESRVAPPILRKS